MAEDVYTSDLTHNPEFTQYINQYMSRSGSVPSASMLDRIIQNELSKANASMFRQRELDLRRAGLTETAREHNINLEEKERDRTAQSATGLLSTAGQLGSMYMMYPHLKDNLF